MMTVGRKIPAPSLFVLFYCITLSSGSLLRVFHKGNEQSGGLTGQGHHVDLPDFSCIFNFEESECLDDIDSTGKPCSWCTEDVGNDSFHMCATQEEAEKEEREGVQCQHNQAKVSNSEGQPDEFSDEEGKADEQPVLYSESSNEVPLHVPDFSCIYNFEESVCLEDMDSNGEPCSWCSKDMGKNVTFHMCATQVEAEKEEKEGAQCKHNLIQNHHFQEVNSNREGKPDKMQVYPSDYSCLQFSADKSSCLKIEQTNELCSWCVKEKEGITFPICAAHGVAEDFLEGKGFQCQNNMRYEVNEVSDKTSM